MTILKKRVEEILNTDYAQYNISSEPSRIDIESAISRCESESRGFQEQLQELNDEWNASASSIQQYCDRMRLYHAQRIAFFVTHGWTDPIELHTDGRTVKDGLHRLKAARYMQLVTVDVTIEGQA
ncbi:MAG: hypothetical protein ABSA06_04230 [Geobacteraceae bacterium]|jgi:hypothetical protein